MYTLDYETVGIDSRPHYPPKPVGVGIKHDDEAGYYLGWGHPEDNNCTEQEAVTALQQIWASGEPLLFQNGKFDLDVAEVHHDLPFPSWERIHDTQFLLYLENPHARQLGLKPSAERILDWPPEEQDRLKQWILGHVPEARPSTWGAYICRSPGTLCGEYCIGDVDRTRALYNHLYPHIVEGGMEGAYDRERRLMPILLGAERFGMRVDIGKLEQDALVFESAFVKANEAIYTACGSDSINLDSPAQVGPALIKQGHIVESRLLLTPTGKLSLAKDSLAGAVDNIDLLHMLRYRGALKTCLSTFIRPWAVMGNEAGGRLHTTWHQTRGAQEKGGTRTGRLSSSHPNLTNVPNDLARNTTPPTGFPSLPLMRSYLLPEEGHVWLKRDYSSQEIRVLAHFEDGALMRQYIDNPNLDPHQFAADLIEQLTGHGLDRADTKRIAFSILYGSGIKALAADLMVEFYLAKQFKELYNAAFPDVAELNADIKKRGDQGLPVRTVGGRLIFAESGKNGRSFSYKLLNHLIQGSASDITKQGVINYAEAGGCQMLALVHDENNVSCPADQVDAQAKLMGECMADVPGFDVPLTSDLYLGTNWETAQKIIKKDVAA